MPVFCRYLSRRWLLAAGIVALLFGLSMLHPYPRQSLFGPTIRGEPWCAWEDAIRRDILWEKHEKSLLTKAMRWFGVAAAETDLDGLYNHEEMVPLLLYLAEDADPQIRDGAIRAIWWYDRLRDNSALPILRMRLHDENIPCRIDAALACAAIDRKERVLPVLTQVLDDPKSAYRFDAMQAVTLVACVDATGFDVMVRHAKDPEPGVRLQVMSELHRHGQKAVPALLTGLEDHDESVRNQAVESLACLGVDAKEAVPNLEKLLSDKTARMRQGVVNALIAIDPQRFQHLEAERKNRIE